MRSYDVDFKTLIGKKTLIKGDVGTGKTRLTENILQTAVKFLPPGHITVIDLAPQRMIVGDLRVGGSISVPNEVKYLRPSKVWAPRLEGKTKEEVTALARANARSIEAIFDFFTRSPSPVLFINDLTLYLHAGSLERLLETIKLADTFVGNAYEGRKLQEDKGSGISERERLLLKKLEGFMDVIIDMNQ
ncbi:MAG: hypothetical protein N3D12_01965 [Candidatus Methanomethyliaceae archaeon]|nr:hypothetical protein [Candidatus Methanomethyliaceae archaeon]